jgi:Protein of unknown function (DUF4232)
MPDGLGFSTAGTDAAMGLRVLTLQVTNCGSVPRTLNGYPSIRLFDDDQHQLDVDVSDGSGGIATVPEFDDPPRAVTLQPGERAWSGLLWRNLVTDPDLGKVETAVRLQAAVTAGQPYREVPLIAPNEVQGAIQVNIDLGNTGRIGVEAWRKATA